MRKAVLLYNPSAGRRQEHRQAEVNAVLEVLRGAGVEVTADATSNSASAAEKARHAAASGCDIVFACGGDGTVHDVLQGLVGSQAALAIIPLGTANALAHDLGLPRQPAAAARAALKAEPRRIAVGRLAYLDFEGNPASRCFTVAAGVGVDAHMFYKLNRATKQRLGMAAYYAQATALWLGHDMPLFAVKFRTRTGECRQAAVSELLAVRITQFGGVLRELAPGASLQEPDLRLVLFRTRSRLRYLEYILRGLLGVNWKVPGIDLVSADRVLCSDLPAGASKPTAPRDARIYVEADGELVGSLPAEITLIPDALTILAPRSRSG
jgi:diacylglycerol kinase (ATP)